MKIPSSRFPSRAQLLHRVFSIDVLECPRCHGRLELIAFIAEATLARSTLDHLGLASPASPTPPRATRTPTTAPTDPTYQE